MPRRVTRGNPHHEQASEGFVKTEIHTLYGPFVLITMVRSDQADDAPAELQLPHTETG
jgi:hypothetical protein